MSLLPLAGDAARPSGRVDSFVGDGPLQPFAAATVLSSADARTALVLAGLDGHVDDPVLLAIALAVRAVRSGNVFVDLATVADTVVPDDDESTVDLAGLPWPDAGGWPAQVSTSPLVGAGESEEADVPLRLVGSRLYLDRYWRYERFVAQDLLRRAENPASGVDTVLLSAGLERLFATTSTESAGGPDLQRVAAATAVLRNFAVLAGGPGTGKTTTVARILALLHEQAASAGRPTPRVALTAPTGKASSRLAEAVQAEADALDISDLTRRVLESTGSSTLHRLLGYQPGRQRFRHDPGNQLPHDVVVVDESSMVSLWLMAKLLGAVRDTTRVILVGDPHQLASVEAGAVLGDVVGPAASGLHLRPAARQALTSVLDEAVAAVDPGPQVSMGDGIVVLRRVHRFGAAISTLASAVERGDDDGVLACLREPSGSIGWVEFDTTRGPIGREITVVRRAVVGAARAVVEAARHNRADEALSALRSVQVLCAHRRGPAGASRWRSEIERWLRAEITGYAGGPWYAGRPLVVTENDYGLGVFNGDTAVVVDIGGGRLRAVLARRDGHLEVRPSRLASADSLHAITIHKAQGSQFSSVIVVLPDAASPVLTRELFYTAVTRAEKQLMVVGTEAAIRAAVTRPVARGSGLEARLWSRGLVDR